MTNSLFPPYVQGCRESALHNWDSEHRIEVSKYSKVQTSQATILSFARHNRGNKNPRSIGSRYTLYHPAKSGDSLRGTHSMDPIAMQTEPSILVWPTSSSRLVEDSSISKVCLCFDPDPCLGAALLSNGAKWKPKQLLHSHVRAVRVKSSFAKGEGEYKQNNVYHNISLETNEVVFSTRKVVNCILRILFVKNHKMETVGRYLHTSKKIQNQTMPNYWSKVTSKPCLLSYNPFNKSFTKELLSSRSQIFPNKLNNVYKYPIKLLGFNWLPVFNLTKENEITGIDNKQLYFYAVLEAAKVINFSLKYVHLPIDNVVKFATFLTVDEKIRFDSMQDIDESGFQPMIETFMVNTVFNEHDSDEDEYVRNIRLKLKLIDDAVECLSQLKQNKNVICLLFDQRAYSEIHKYTKTTNKSGMKIAKPVFAYYTMGYLLDKASPYQDKFKAIFHKFYESGISETWNLRNELKNINAEDTKDTTISGNTLIWALMMILSAVNNFPSSILQTTSSYRYKYLALFCTLVIAV
ncbi:hypothetical protein TSAR_004053 [Trichomalopsis sarcophagae]|uniref:Uncharacterized protein n=1 Tax=Trichomalopsis sarcophagae TaxID=543379 RepID=A0A232FME9_9HYME|nr:hypothetical protein TSAR_004053 [Trichomalopsis sarcophagae]